VAAVGGSERFGAGPFLTRFHWNWAASRRMRFGDVLYFRFGHAERREGLVRAIQVVFVFGFGLAGGAFGQIEGLLPLEDTSAPVTVDVSNRADLEAFIDGLMAGYLEAYHTAGAVVSIVKDGEVALAKGYGSGACRSCSSGRR
jgi:CubicO group peptidase (beta-lactamase class C family)